MIVRVCSFLLIAGCLIAASLAQENTYEGYKIYDVIPKTEEQRELLHVLSKNAEEYDFLSLTKLLNHAARVLVGPKTQEKFEHLVEKYGLEYSVVNPDVSRTIEAEKIENRARWFGLRPTKIDLTKYNRHDVINSHLDDLAKRYSNRVSVHNLGRSYEGRQLKALNITNGDGRKGKKVIFVDAGIHAREWIAPATALYIIQQLVENYSQNQHLLKDYNWIVLPVVNPDGYEYTHTSNRYWRKTRKPSSSSCFGTDANRNFDFHWGETGASSQPCTETFMGAKAFSEPEAAIVRDALHAFNGTCKFYLTLHSYGNYLLYPWGYAPELPPTWRDLDEVSKAGADAIRNATGTRYTYGSSTNVLYEAAGASDDYAFGRANVPISITMELPSGGVTGFDPPVSKIKPYTEEAWIGIKAMAQKVIQKY